MKLRGNFHDLQIIDMQGCVGFYFLLFDIYTTDILLFCTRVMKRCFLGHFRLKLTPFPYRLWQRFRLTKYVLNWIKSWVTFENYFLTSPIRYHYPSAIYRHITGWETTLTPSPAQSQLQQPKKIYTYKVKMWSMSDSVA